MVLTPQDSRGATITPSWGGAKKKGPLDDPALRPLLFEIDRLGCSYYYLGRDRCVAAARCDDRDRKPWVVLSDGNLRLDMAIDRVLWAIQNLPNRCGPQRFWSTLIRAKRGQMGKLFT